MDEMLNEVVKKIEMAKQWKLNTLELPMNPLYDIKKYPIDRVLRVMGYEIEILNREPNWLSHYLDGRNAKPVTVLKINWK